MADPTDGTVPWRVFLAEAERRLAAAGLPSPEVDARRIVERATGTHGAELVLVLDDPATERGVGFFDLMVARREAGEPLQYVLGAWGFRELDLFVDRRVLIPRPETEEVVEQALRELDLVVAARPGERPQVVDLGTGSGAIALSIAVERDTVDVWAVERSADAAAVARANLAGIGRAATRVRIVEGSWFEPLPPELHGRCSLVVSNPPYVAPADPLPPEVADWEPREALVPGPTGFEAIDEIVHAAVGWLVPGGALVVELAPGQGEDAVAAAWDAGFVHAETRPDLTGRTRMLVGRTSR
ncbi:peptide chain release factor N(5)-glutamine methyltransferase [Actinomarinicola tropica]|uniref:Release factor glutamine methyltransferase n=1 Tax=Actinomarinicola tropica TaxID=2789776 RepID=A0A5Q2RCH0_9ACTN|nr:peptide chain release factor N(5)-glutamine methyltransferase [Actinomarinicola tropica]QGG94589.1 peptide chain release factor N(5)-glutamine methyltransferase [Actinomarinicola tropica]